MLAARGAGESVGSDDIGSRALKTLASAAKGTWAIPARERRLKTTGGRMKEIENDKAFTTKPPSIGPANVMGALVVRSQPWNIPRIRAEVPRRNFLQEKAVHRVSDQAPEGGGHASWQIDSLRPESWGERVWVRSIRFLLCPVFMLWFDDTAGQLYASLVGEAFDRVNRESRGPAMLDA
jgi:hypothetical protein